MEGCVLLAIAVGALAATALTMIAFCIGLSVALVVGLGNALLLFPDPIAVLIGAIVLFAAVQVGYGLGLGLWALVRHRRGLPETGLGTTSTLSKEPARHPR